MTDIIADRYIYSVKQYYVVTFFHIHVGSECCTCSDALLCSKEWLWCSTLCLVNCIHTHFDHHLCIEHLPVQFLLLGVITA